MSVFLTIFCWASIFITLDAAKSMGPVGNIIANAIYLCKEKPQGKEMVLNIDLKKIDGKGNKAMVANMTTTIDVDQTIEYTLDVDTFENGNWKPAHNVKGKFCRDMVLLFGTLWQKIRTTAVPPINHSCPIKAGTYVLEKFQASSKELTIPTIFYGRFKLKLVLLKGGKMITCVQGEGDSQAP